MNEQRVIELRIALKHFATDLLDKGYTMNEIKLLLGYQINWVLNDEKSAYVFNRNLNESSDTNATFI